MQWYETQGREPRGWTKVAVVIGMIVAFLYFAFAKPYWG